MVIKKRKALQRVAFRLSPEYTKQVDDIASKSGVTPSDVYRHIVEAFFSSQCQQNVDIFVITTEQR